MSFRTSFQAIGTTWNIEIQEDLSSQRSDAVLAAIHTRIATFDATYSRFRADSLVGRIAREAGKYRFPADAEALFAFYESLYCLTDGLMTPLVGQVLVDAGYDAAYSLSPKTQIAPARKWEEVMQWRVPVLTVHEPVTLDFGAIGKGYLIDFVVDVLLAHGLQRFVVEAGGDMIHRGDSSTLRVALEDPDDPKRAVGVVELHGRSLCGSAGNRRAWRQFHHIINPRTVTSPRHILALWVVADTTMLADALATALFFVEPERLKKVYRFEYAILRPDRTVQVSAGFPGELFVVGQ